MRRTYWLVVEKTESLFVVLALGALLSLIGGYVFGISGDSLRLGRLLFALAAVLSAVAIHSYAARRGAVAGAIVAPVLLLAAGAALFGAPDVVHRVLGPAAGLLSIGVLWQSEQRRRTTEK